MHMLRWGAGAPAPGAAGGVWRRAARNIRLRTLPRVSPPCAQSFTLMIVVANPRCAAVRRDLILIEVFKGLWNVGSEFLG